MLSSSWVIDSISSLNDFKTDYANNTKITVKEYKPSNILQSKGYTSSQYGAPWGNNYFTYGGTFPFKLIVGDDINKISGENGSYMFYSFGKKFFSENQNALELTFGKVKNPTEITVAFLYNTDFKGKKLISSLPSRNTCTILLSDDCDQ